jgi:small subunit ribosomal protein S1
LSGHSLDSLSRFLEEAERRIREPVTSPAPEAAVDGSMGSQAVSAVDTAWEEARRAFEDGKVLTGVVTGWNRGGLLVRWNDLQGFVPASQLKEVPIFGQEDNREDVLARWIGEDLSLKVIELDRSRNRLVFSERATLWGPRDGDRVLDDLGPGQVCSGHVSNICDFGVFVDLGGVDGLVHLSELSWGRVSHPRDLLAIGQQVSVYVISMDKGNRRIALSLKRLKPDPWTVVESTYRPNQVLDAVITNVVAFGAFAQIEEGLEGLIHISEICDAKITHPAEMVSPGDQVRVRILRIDSAGHRLGLSMRFPEAGQDPDGGAGDGADVEPSGSIAEERTDDDAGDWPEGGANGQYPG